MNKLSRIFGKSYVALCVVAGLVGLLSACAAGVATKATSPDGPGAISTPAVSKFSSTAIKLPAQEPLAVSVVDEVNDGSRLALRLKVSALSALNTSAVQLVVLTFREGELLESTTYQLQDLLREQASRERAEHAEQVLAGEEHTVTLIVPAKGATDYQIEIQWVPQSSSSAAKPAGALPAPSRNSLACALILRDVQLERIQEGSGEASIVKLRLTGVFLNPSATAVPAAVLGVRYVLRGAGDRAFGSDSAKGIFGIEEQVNIPNLNLASRSDRRFRITLTQPLTSEEALGLDAETRVIGCASEDG